MAVKSDRNNVFIRKVILENFLSFERDEVDFEDKKFILILGPNWSGKTSIFQAIKFGLGSNERDERYKKWSDFIRHGQNHAMVELHIQSNSELFQIRRYVIRGQSPYYLLKKDTDKDFKKIQALEIQNIISDLKYNPDNHFAFVSQGKIDAIKSLKSSEICNFLEEGIGLKGLRDEILKQKGNVIRLNNELKALNSKKNVLNISLDLIQPKLLRLVQKHKLLDVKKTYEDELLWANREKLKKDIQILERDYLKIQVNIDEIKSIKEKNEKQVREYEDLISKLEKEANQSIEELGRKKQIKNELISKIQNWQAEKIKVKQELDDLTNKINEGTKLLENYNQHKSKLDGEFRIMETQINDIEVQIDHLIQEQNKLSEKIKINKEFIDQYNQLNSDQQVNQKALKANEDKIKRINDEINQIFQSFSDIEHKLESNKWFLKNPTKDLLKQLDNELKKINSVQYSLSPNIEQLKREKSKKLDKLKLLQQSLRERRVILPPSIIILKDEIKKRELNVKGPLIEYLKYDDKLSYAIESVLGEKLLYSFVADNWETMKLLNKLRAKYNAYCNIYLPKNITISPFSKIESEGVIGYLAELINVIGNEIDIIKKVIYSKVSNCLVVEDYRNGESLYKKINFKGKCVTLKGEQIISYKYAYEAPHVKRLKGLLSAGTQQEQANILEKELKNINEEVLENEVKLTKLDEEKREILKRIDAFNDLIYTFNQKQRLTAKKNDLYDQRKNLENNNTKILENVEQINNKLKEIQAQTDPEFFKWNDRIKEIPELLNNYNTEKKNWTLKLSENQKIEKDIENNINFQNTDLTVLNKEYKTKNENFQKADKEAYYIYKELGSTEDSIIELEANILNLNEKRNKIKENKKDLDINSIQVNLRFEQENIHLNSIKQELNIKKEDLERINLKIKPLIAEKKIKIRSIEDINKDIIKIEKELLSYLDVDDSLLVEKDQILAGLKEITKSHRDLENDIDAALKTENKMEETYYNKFNQILDDLENKINRKFESSEVKAYCSLELTGNFEELGVEIKAALTKEQLKSCTALSGGQVSMISICLILSLQELKPSPLCMLDEAVMFLDDKNSEIAYQMIKSTLEQNPNIQMILFLPKSSNVLYLLTDKLIGVARTGKKEVSTIFKPKIIKKKE